MADVVRNLQAVPDHDLRAMANYLASFNTPLSEPQAQQMSQAVIARAAQSLAASPNAAQRLFESACGSCHHDGDGPRLLGVNVPLGLNTNLHSDRPDNAIRVILEGIQHPPTRAVGFMPGFHQALDDAQLTELLTYMRQRYAPDKPAWSDLPGHIARVRTNLSRP